MNNLLYHFTTRRNLNKILKEDKLRGSISYDRSVSFTRDKNLHKKSTYLQTHRVNAIIIIDRDKLRNDYKLECYNHFPGITRKECEERVIGNITNLKKYIIKTEKF